jgi:hypothetical protein
MVTECRKGKMVIRSSKATFTSQEKIVNRNKRKIEIKYNHKKEPTKDNKTTEAL